MSLAPSLADAGLHAELWTDCHVLPDIAARVRELPVQVVIDHMGGFDASAGIEEPGFRCLLSLVETGHAWVKLCVYRNLLGDDETHLGITERLELLDVFKHWTGSEALTEQILATNPAALYG